MINFQLISIWLCIKYDATLVKYTFIFKYVYVKFIWNSEETFSFNEIYLLNQLAIVPLTTNCLYLFPNIVQYFCTMKHLNLNWKWEYLFQRHWSDSLLKMEVVNIFSENFANISQKVHSVLLENSTEKEGERDTIYIPNFWFFKNVLKKCYFNQSIL